MASPLQPVDFSPHERNPHLGNEPSTYDLIEPMEYLYVKVLKARNLASTNLTYVVVEVGNLRAETKAISKMPYPEWQQVFAFGKERFYANSVEITVKKKNSIDDDLLGYVQIPIWLSPDTLAPRWYKLEGKKGESKNVGEIMVSLWEGTQTDDAFPEAWQSDAGGYSQARSKVYLSPKLWYLRVNVIEAQNLVPSGKGRLPEARVKVQLGFQILRTEITSKRSTGYFWNRDLLFVVAEPFEEPLIVTVEDRISPNQDEDLGKTQISLASVETRIDPGQVTSRWYNLEKDQVDEKKENRSIGRIHLRICLDGGYHVLDELTHNSSDLRPSANQICRDPIGFLDLGILKAANLSPIKKAKDGRGRTDAYCIAKYGQKWVRSRTIIDNLSPKWNEQYRWEVYDPCTVLTVAVFDNSQIHNGSKANTKDTRIGKLRIRLSMLENGNTYIHSYPLLALQPSCVSEMGELYLAIRFSCSSFLKMISCYAQPLLPQMHYLHPLGISQLEILRNSAMKIVSLRLSRHDSPLRQEVVEYILDVDCNMWSMRKSKANWLRIISVFSGLSAVCKWFDDICAWKSPITTVLVHILLLILVWYPELIFPTIFLYTFLIGAWRYRFRPQHPPRMDLCLPHVHVKPDELDEEFDPFPTKKAQEIVRARYDRLRAVAGRIQTFMGDLATQGERFEALLSWNDPHATGIFITFCLAASMILYITPFRFIIVLFAFYILRHPRFRQKMPAVPMNFFRRLPSLSHRML